VVVDDHAETVAVVQQADGVSDGLPRQLDLSAPHRAGAVEHE
jgi:hypothetical protein